MDKMKTFKTLRKQLATEYEAEILAVNDLLHNGIEAIGGTQSTLNVSLRDPDTSIGDARRAMAEDLQNSVRMVMQRYAKGLEDEIADLGLLKKDVETFNVSLAKFDRDWTPEPPLEPLPVKPSTVVDDGGPVLNLRNPFQEPVGAKPASPTAFLDRSADAPRPPNNGTTNKHN
ncbi:MAG: hypothetical protein ACR2O4_08835 [Hyphomicrobiaceae bacterium]